MKIIAEMPGQKVLIEATKDEVANLLGYASTYYVHNRNDQRVLIEPGLVIHISRMWTRLKKIEAIPGTLRRLDEMADAIKHAIAPATVIVERELDVGEQSDG